MAYDGRILHRAQQRFEEDRRLREENFHRRQEEIFDRQPRLRGIDRELRSTMSHIIASALRRGTDPRPAVAVLREKNLKLQTEKKELLRELGLPADALEEKPACSACGDTGFRDGSVCRCLRAYYAREQKKELSALLDLGSQSFDTFSLDWYSERLAPDYGISPRQNMETVYEVCADYASHFGGGAETAAVRQSRAGQDFLSACIARLVSDGGFPWCTTPPAHLDRFESRKFGREEAARRTPPWSGF